MKAWGLDGKSYKLSGGAGKGRTKSSYHMRARALLKVLFGFDPVLEEVFLPGCATALYLDFLLPRRMLAIEVQGEQHENFVLHFHGDKDGFRKAKGRDGAKHQWAELNNITLVELDHGDTDEQWAAQLGRPLDGSPENLEG